MRKLIEISLGPRSCKAQVAALLPAFGTAIEKKPAGELDRDAMFAKLKQLGGKQQVAPKAWWQELCHRLIRFIAHTRGVDEIEVVADGGRARIDLVAFSMGTISGARQPRARRMSARAAHRL